MTRTHENIRPTGTCGPCTHPSLTLRPFHPNLPQCHPNRDACVLELSWEHGKLTMCWGQGRDVSRITGSNRTHLVGNSNMHNDGVKYEATPFSRYEFP